MTAPTAPRTEAERAALVREVSNAHMDGAIAAYNGVNDAGLSRALRERANAYAERVVPPVAPRRVAPSHKGVTYRDGAWWNGACRHTSAAAVIMNVNGFTDDDHAPLLALRDAPTVDPVEEFRALVSGALSDTYSAGKHEGSRSGWVGTDTWRDQIVTAALALVDQYAAPERGELTAEECVARLVELRWTDRPGIQVGAVMRRALVAPAPERAP